MGLRNGRMVGFKEWVDGWIEGQREKVRGVYGFARVGFEFARGMREKVRGEYGV